MRHLPLKIFRIGSCPFGLHFVAFGSRREHLQNCLFLVTTSSHRLTVGIVPPVPVNQHEGSSVAGEIVFPAIRSLISETRYAGCIAVGARVEHCRSKQTNRSFSTHSCSLAPLDQRTAHRQFCESAFLSGAARVQSCRASSSRLFFSSEKR